MRNRYFMFKILRQRILVTLAFALSFLLGVAQNAVVKGVITDETGDPVENVVVRGTDFDRQTISDEHGHFSITVPSGRDIQLFLQHLSHQDTLLTFHLKPKRPTGPTS